MKKYRKFTEEEKRFIRETLPGHSSTEVAEMFNARFSPPVNAKKIRFEGPRLGIMKRRAASLPVGAEMMMSGRTYVKNAEGRWKNKMLLLWEEANGKMPEGHCVIPADKNRLNFALDNLLLVSKAELRTMNRLRLYSADPDMTRLGHVMAKMRIAANIAIREKLKMRSYHFRRKEEKRLKREGTTQ